MKFFEDLRCLEDQAGDLNVLMKKMELDGSQLNWSDSKSQLKRALHQFQPGNLLYKYLKENVQEMASKQEQSTEASRSSAAS